MYSWQVAQVTLQPSFKVSMVIFSESANSKMLRAAFMSSMFTVSLVWSVDLFGVDTKVNSSSFTRILLTVSCTLSSFFSLSQALKKLLSVVWIVFCAHDAVGRVSIDGVGEFCETWLLQS